MKKSGVTVFSFSDFVNESNKLATHKIKSEKYWRQIVGDDSYLSKVLDTVLKKQNGFATDRQMTLLRKKENGDNSPFPTKN